MTNLYFPDADSDMFEYNENDFIYQCTRDKMNGTDPDATCLFSEMLFGYERWMEAMDKRNKEILEEEYKNDETSVGM